MKCNLSCRCVPYPVIVIQPVLCSLNGDKVRRGIKLPYEGVQQNSFLLECCRLFSLGRLCCPMQHTLWCVLTSRHSHDGSRSFTACITLYTRRNGESLQKRATSINENDDSCDKYVCPVYIHLTFFLLLFILTPNIIFC